MIATENRRLLFIGQFVIWSRGLLSKEEDSHALKTLYCGDSR